MLYALGPLTFEIAPVNAHEINRATEANYVAKPVVGRRPPLEFTGDGPEEITVSAKLFPQKFGGMSLLAMLDQMRRSGVSARSTETFAALNQAGDARRATTAAMELGVAKRS